jgi:flagellar L-ring protein precursor FlgH
MKRSSLLLAVALLGAATGARAQGPAPGAAAADTAARAAAAPDTAAATGSLARARASWLSDRLPLRVGDILTVTVDEQTAARERVSQIATGNRSQRAKLAANINDDSNTADINLGLNADSRDIGEAGREGGLVAVLSVRVTAIEPNGVARVSGTKQVTVDGRLQEITLQGVVRPEDVSSSNVVLSSRIAEAVVSYKGKKIGPRTGILGRFLAMLWP